MLPLFDPANRRPGEGQFVPQAEYDRAQAAIRGEDGVLLNGEAPNPNQPIRERREQTDAAVYREANNIYEFGHYAVTYSITQAVEILSEVPSMRGQINSSQDLLNFTPLENTPDIYFEQVARIYSVFGKYILGNYGRYLVGLSDDREDPNRYLYYRNNLAISDQYQQAAGGNVGNRDPRTDFFRQKTGKLIARDFFRTDAPSHYITIVRSVADIRTESIELLGLIRSNE